ncbi:MAG: DegT/DnrJ/EryC1/StrS family aminotransferase [Candidatus Omnitrophica bacterium]|nr:DegT/DnrJ/EryC1/StrS family aminotransferase [Candidatus Omnitrophota bacterium]
MAKMIIPCGKPSFWGNEKAYLMDAFDSTWISRGKYIEQFEGQLVQELDAGFGAVASSGTAALQLALLALGAGPGDEVIVPGYSFAAPVNMVIAVGATPVYADVNPETWCLDASRVARCVTDKTKAILAIHIYGNMCDMDALKKVAQEHNLYLVEDAAEALFSKYAGKYSGTWGDVGCFSFQATKTLTMGEGGFVVTQNKELYDKMFRMRNHGMDPDKHYWHKDTGFNFRLTNLQAAIGCAQLEKVDEIK